MAGLKRPVNKYFKLFLKTLFLPGESNEKTALFRFACLEKKGLFKNTNPQEVLCVGGNIVTSEKDCKLFFDIFFERYFSVGCAVVRVVINTFSIEAFGVDSGFDDAPAGVLRGGYAGRLFRGYLANAIPRSGE